MKENQLKTLLKHIISEVNTQIGESYNYDDFDDPSNVANAIYDGLYSAPNLIKTEPDGSQVYRFSLHSPTGPKHAIKRDSIGHWWYLDEYSHNWKPADEYIKAKISDREHYKKTGERRDEMIANKDVEPDVMGAVNVEESHVGAPYSDKTARAYKEGLIAGATDTSVGKRTVNPYKGGDLEGYWAAGYNDGKETDSEDSVEENYYDTNNPDDVTDTCKEGLLDFGKGDVKKKAKELFGKIKKITKTSHPSSNSEYFTISFEVPGNEKIIRKDKDGKLWLAKHEGDKLKFEPLEFGDKVKEQSSSGAAGAFATPFAFKPTGGVGERHRKKKKKKVKESIFLQKVRDKIKGSVDSAKGITAEKINPDGTYSNNMEDPMHMNKVHGLSEDDENKKEKLKILLKKRQELLKRFKNSSGEGDSRNTHLAQRELDYEIKKLKQSIDEETSSGAVGQSGGIIQTPAWGTKNKLGSPKAQKVMKNMGWKTTKSITYE